MQYPFLQASGEMARLISNYKWQDNPLGSIEHWPQSLKNTVSMLLSCRFPMFLWWGDEHIQLYNDAYRDLLGDNGKHPDALGQKAIDCWPEAWDTIYPLMQSVMKGDTGVWFEDMYLPIHRNGKLDDVYWTFSYSAVRNDENVIEGILVICNETTEKVLNLKRLEESKDELEFAMEATELGSWDLNPETGTFSGNNRLKEWFGLRPEEHIPLELATNVIAEKDRSKVVAAINEAMKFESGGGYDVEYTIIHPVTKTERIVKAMGRAWFNDERQPYRFNGTLQDITKSRLAQRETEEANKLTQLVLKSAGVGLFIVDLLSGEMSFNEEFSLILTGQPDKSNFSRRDFMAYLHPEDLADREAALLEGSVTNEFYYSPRVIWDDGTVHRIHVMGTNALNGDGKPVTFSGTVRDITILENQRIAIENAEMEQRRSDAMFRNITDSSPTGLWLSDDKGNIIYVNRILTEWTGKSYTEFMGTGWHSTIVEEDRPKYIAALTEAIQNKRHFDVLFRMLMADGREVWCRAAGDGYYDHNGKFEGYAGYVLDIDEIVEGRKALMQSEQRLRSMIEQAPVATCLFTGKDMVIEVANEIMLGYWGKNKSAIGMPLGKAVPELVGQPFLDILDQVYTTGIPYQSNAVPADLKINGEIKTYYFDFTYQPVFDTNGAIYGVMDMAIDVTEQVLAQQRIAQSQRQILDSFEQSPVGIAVIEKDELTFTMANPFYCSLVGRSNEGLIGKPLLEALPEIKGQGFDKLLENVINSGIPYTAKEVSVQLERDGILETIYVDLNYQPMLGSDNAVTGVLVVATDVTQQVLARIEVELSEAKLRSIISSAPAGIGLFVGRELIVEMPNQTFIDIVGKGWSIVGKPLREAMPELITHGQPFLKILDDVFTTGKMYQSYGDQVLIEKNGEITYNYYNITYTPLFDNNNEVYAILDIAIDVTEAIEARQNAENIGNALQGAISLAGLATWRYNIKENTFSYSDRFMDWLGFSERTQAIDDAYNPIPADYAELVDDALRAAIAPGSDGKYDYEYPIINRKTGQIRIIHAQAQVTYDNSGAPEFLTGSAQDVTRERKLQQQLEYEVQQRTEELQAANADLADAINALQQNNEELQQFAYIASHDLQEPTRKISIFSKMLVNSLQNIDLKSKDYLNKINNSADRMGDLITDILAYSQLAKDNDLFKKVSLKSIADDTITDFDLIIEQTGAHIDYAELPEIEAIPRQMSQLFGNLISNSLKYRRPDVAPEITVRSQRLDDLTAKENFHAQPDITYHKITFSDNGIGFSQEYSDKIFNIFQRLHGKSEYSGTGIGLSICKKIVQNHHGYIEAYSEKDKGATFIIILPEKQNFENEKVFR